MVLYSNLNNVMETRDHLSNGVSPKNLKSRRNFLRIALTITATLFAVVSFAQEPDYKGNPKENERVIGNVAGVSVCSDRGDCYAEAYVFLLAIAKKEHPNKVIDLRNVIVTGERSKMFSSAKVVELNSSSPETKLNESLVKAVDRALSKVNEGSRLAIDQISVSGDLSRETVKDQLIDVLLNKEYRVVAKEYLEKLKEEQEKQTSGGFNEKTTARTDNFSGVGYFLNVRVNEQSIRVQVINVSTGEYEGNATVEF